MGAEGCKVSSRGASIKAKQVSKGRGRWFRLHGYFFPNTIERDTEGRAAEPSPNQRIRVQRGDAKDQYFVSIRPRERG